MTNLVVSIGLPICGIIIFLNPVTYRDLIFKHGLRRLTQIDDAASDDVCVDYLGPKHATDL